MKIETYILFVSVFLLSCQAKDREGVWVGENEKWNSYVLANISNDSLTLKYLSSFNYHLSDKPQIFIAEEGNMFSNDSFKIEVNLTDSLELITYKNDSLIQIEKFYKLNQYNPELNIIDFKNALYEKSIHYEMKDYEVHIDIVDSIRAYNYNVERTPKGFDYYEIFKLGGEIFFILDTGYPLPLQLVKPKKDNNKISISTELFSQKGELTINKRQILNDKLKGKWIIQHGGNDKTDAIKFITINGDSFKVNRINQEEDSFEVSKLSKDNLYFLRTDSLKPFLLKIDQMEKTKIFVTNYRNRRESKMTLIKE